jgi:hypothetical protein
MVHPVEAALTTGGFVTNLICDDGSLVLTNPRGEQIVIRAKVLLPLEVADKTTDRSIGSIYTNGDYRRTVTIALFLAAGDTVASANYQTVSGGTSLNCEFGYNDLSDGTLGCNQWCSFKVDAGAAYSITANVGENASVAIRSWVESDEVL